METVFKLFFTFLSLGIGYAAGISATTVYGDTIKRIFGDRLRDNPLSEKVGEQMGTFIAVGLSGFLISWFAFRLFYRDLKLRRRYRLYSLHLGTSGGEIQAVSSEDKEFIDRVSRAVKTAIVERT